MKKLPFISVFLAENQGFEGPEGPEPWCDSGTLEQKAGEAAVNQELAARYTNNFREYLAEAVPDLLQTLVELHVTRCAYACLYVHVLLGGTCPSILFFLV